MMQLEVGGLRYSIAAGETVVGSDPSCTILLTGDGVQPRHAIVQGLANGSAAIRRAAQGAEILVNGVRQGDDPTPVLHGDKIQIGTHELLVVDPARAGHTKFFDSSAFEKFTPPAPSRPAAVAVATGGRLVCLTDGREYHVGAALVIGRDASADVVVPGNEVSRRHAQIVATEQGFVLVDTSTNGSFVNGQRVEGSCVLQRADVIRIGADEFRFYAEAAPVPAAPAPEPPKAAAPPAPAPPAPPAPEPAAPPPEPAAPGEAPTGAQQRLFNTMFGVGGVPEAGTPPSGPVTPISVVDAPIASLLVRSGSLKGKRLTVRTPVVNIGRADYNDLVLPEPSVSSSHAKLQRREGIWVLSDLGSTNGTFVDGERVTDETPLGPGATIRFGEVTALFESTDDTTGIQQRVGTRMVQGMPPAPPASDTPRRPLRAPAPAPPPPTVPRWAILAAVLAIAAVIAFMLLR
ncbi:MAG: FHA domain-containing protein [Deltaproteobacteria bacterium]